MRGGTGAQEIYASSKAGARAFDRRSSSKLELGGRDRRRREGTSWESVRENVGGNSLEQMALFVNATGVYW